jgi:hypothetical protein
VASPENVQPVLQILTSLDVKPTAVTDRVGLNHLNGSRYG